jgi:hypothetical protein
MFTAQPKENNMTIRSHALALRRAELARIVRSIGIEWSTLIHKAASSLSSGLAQWHAHARNLHLD